MMETQSATQMSSSVKMATSTADCASHPEVSRLTFMAAATSIVASRERRLMERERLLSLPRPPWRTNISEKGERGRAESAERREWRDESVQRAPSATADSHGSCSLKVDWNNYLDPLQRLALY